jgi:tRNA threonylcarbamoyladenosine biosynthesis protein TsaB
MKVLALELSSAVGSIAFCDEDETRDFRTFPADRKDSRFFYENLSTVYQADGPADLIIVGLGPGSYAGVRIAIATALGLREASGARLRGLPSISAVDQDEYAFVGDARRSSFFFAHVVNGRCLEGPTLGSLAEIQAKVQEARPLPIVATQPLVQFGQVSVEHPSALRLAQLGLQAKDEGDETLEPIYLRAPYITTPRK